MPTPSTPSLIFRWFLRLLHFISGGWINTNLLTNDSMVQGDDSGHSQRGHSEQVGSFSSVATSFGPSSVAEDHHVHILKGGSDIIKSKSITSMQIRSQKVVMSYRRRRVNSKLLGRPRSNPRPLETQIQQPHGLNSPSCSPSVQSDSNDVIEAISLPVVPAEDDCVNISSPASTTATLVDHAESPSASKNPVDLPSDESDLARSPILLSAQCELGTEEPPIAVDIPAPAPINASDANSNTNSDSTSPPRSQSPKVMRINTGVFTPKGSFKIRISDKSYCKWHKMVFQQRIHPDEKTAFYFKHLHESEEELLEIQRIASLGPVPKPWTPKYQQMWFDWIEKQEFRTWTMTHYNEDRPGV